MVVIGIEGGGTNSILSINDLKGNELYTYKFNSLNLYSTDIDMALNNMYSAIITSLNKLQLTLNNVISICIGAASLGRQKEKEIFKEFFTRIKYQGKLYLLSDAEITLLAHSTNKPSVLIISGTGSIAISYDSNNILHRTGGWGHLLGDEGSAYDIGKQALNHSLKFYDKTRCINPFIYNILKSNSLKDISHLINYIYTNPNKAIIADMALIVNELALAGDKLCINILNEAGTALSKLVISLLAKVNYKQPPSVICHGSVLKNSELVYKSFKHELMTNEKLYNISKSHISPLKGAISVAIKKINK